jgi:hypothetical protein
MKVWTTAAVVVAAVLYATALDNDVYTLTSPHSITSHVFLRKAYSIGAFALVGYLSGRAFQEWGRRPNAAGLALLVGLYSAAIEVGQAFHGSDEGLAWNAFDTGCGAVGGLIAGLVLKVSRRPS